MKPSVCSSFLCLALLWAVQASAEPRIYLNNVDITYVRNQAFEHVESVFIDAEGNIIMRAPQYQISEKTETGLKAAQESYVEPKGTKRPTQEELDAMTSTLPDGNKPVYLVAKFNAPGLMGYNVEVWINQVLVTTLDQNEPQYAIDVTPHLHPGKNDIRYRTIMAASAGRSSRASVEIYYAVVNQETASQIELMGSVAKKVISGGTEASTYTVSLFKP